MEVVNTTTTSDPVNMYNNLNKYILNPTVFIIFILIIISYYIFSSSLGNNGVSTASNSVSNKSNSSIIKGIIIFILIILIVINAFQYFFSINVKAYLQDLFTSHPKVDIVVDQNTYPQPAPVAEMKFKKQVFNIPGNYYDYENADAICKAYGSNLATYDQIEKAYNNGAEWCNYGWSANQLALFPTQKQTYDHLQTIEGHKNDCGRTGINGGYMANPKIKFGVNCFGYKPKITQEEDELMQTSTAYPETAQESDFQKRVDYWKTKVDEILVSPFNYNKWGV